MAYEKWSRSSGQAGDTEMVSSTQYERLGTRDSKVTVRKSPNQSLLFLGCFRVGEGQADLGQMVLAGCPPDDRPWPHRLEVPSENIPSVPVLDGENISGRSHCQTSARAWEAMGGGGARAPGKLWGGLGGLGSYGGPRTPGKLWGGLGRTAAEEESAGEALA